MNISDLAVGDEIGVYGRGAVGYPHGMPFYYEGAFGGSRDGCIRVGDRLIRTIYIDRVSLIEDEYAVQNMCTLPKETP